MSHRAAEVTCAEFDDAVADLAVDGIGEPSRGALRAHASGCRRCGGQLAALSGTADELLLLAPTIEPPPGFESRALARMSAPGGARSARPALRRAAVAVALVVAFGIGVAVRPSASSGGRSRAAPIVATSGGVVGTVKLSGSPRPYVLITIDSPRRSGGKRSCELEMADGRRIVVGSWTAEEIASGAWAVAIERALLRATAMRIVDDHGSVIATATFH